MKVFFQFFLCLAILSGKASALTLQAGDILLQSNDCYLCALIEAEEHTPYSHMGVVVSNLDQWNVLEAWGNVRRTSLAEFLGRKRAGTQTLVLRADDVGKLSATMGSATLLTRFQTFFEGKNYDPDFLWNNSDELGEKYYCSEFVAKFLRPFLIHPISTKAMHYEVNRDAWIKYFRGTPPDGLPGLSPGDFERSPLFQKAGFL